MSLQSSVYCGYINPILWLSFFGSHNVEQHQRTSTIGRPWVPTEACLHSQLTGPQRLHLPILKVNYMPLYQHSHSHSISPFSWKDSAWMHSNIQKLDVPSGLPGCVIKTLGWVKPTEHKRGCEEPWIENTRWRSMVFLPLWCACACACVCVLSDLKVVCSHIITQN